MLFIFIYYTIMRDYIRSTASLSNEVFWIYTKNKYRGTIYRTRPSLQLTKRIQVQS